jgi:hypothetical protein
VSIWDACEGAQYICDLKQEPWRVVEAQHILNSRDLVDTLEEYDILEELLDSSKPTIQTNILDPLIFTPFRYPPLEYGSRFGRIFEPSLWYGSLDIKTALTEVAYYRLKFNQDTEANLGYVDTLLTAFNVCIKTNQGVDLTKLPFTKYQHDISSKTSYTASQLLGSDMRADNIEAFVFYSARAKQAEKNIGIYSMNVFIQKNERYSYNQQTWKCVSNQEDVQIARTDGLGKHEVISYTNRYFS